MRYADKYCTVNINKAVSNCVPLRVLDIFMSYDEKIFGISCQQVVLCCFILDQQVEAEC